MNDEKRVLIKMVYRLTKWPKTNVETSTSFTRKMNAEDMLLWKAQKFATKCVSEIVTPVRKIKKIMIVLN